MNPSSPANAAQIQHRDNEAVAQTWYGKLNASFATLNHWGLVLSNDIRANPFWYSSFVLCFIMFLVGIPLFTLQVWVHHLVPNLASKLAVTGFAVLIPMVLSTIGVWRNKTQLRHSMVKRLMYVYYVFVATGSFKLITTIMQDAYPTHSHTFDKVYFYSWIGLAIISHLHGCCLNLGYEVGLTNFCLAFTLDAAITCAKQSPLNSVQPYGRGSMYYYLGYLLIGLGAIVFRGVKERCESKRAAHEEEGA